jgi:hypothetical protein
VNCQEYHCFHHHTNIGAFSCIGFDHLTGEDSAYLKHRGKSFTHIVTYGVLD